MLLKQNISFSYLNVDEDTNDFNLDEEEQYPQNENFCNKCSNCIEIFYIVQLFFVIFSLQIFINFVCISSFGRAIIFQI